MKISKDTGLHKDRVNEENSGFRDELISMVILMISLPPIAFLFITLYPKFLSIVERLVQPNQFSSDGMMTLTLLAMIATLAPIMFFMLTLNHKYKSRKRHIDRENRSIR